MKGMTLRAPLARIAIVLAAALAVLATVAVVTGPADAAPPKKFTFSIDPGSVVEDEPTELTFTLTNTSPNPIDLGSANITIPDGLDVEIVGSPAGVDIVDWETEFIIELRDLSLPRNTSWTGAFLVTAADCVPDTYEWVVVAKQANDFAGEGNEFALEGSYPVTAVTCEEEEEEEDPETTQGPQPGFTPPGGWDYAEFCPGKSPCPPAQVTLENTTALLTPGGNAAALFLAVKEESPMACGSDFSAVSEDIYFDVIGGQGGKTLTITLVGAAGLKDLEDYEVCFGGDSPWTQADGFPAVYDGTHFWVGTLDDCPAPRGNRPPGHDQGLGKPIACVISIVESGGNVVIVIYAPPGDPRIKIG
jgi:hypothetical protein